MRFAYMEGKSTGFGKQWKLENPGVMIRRVFWLVLGFGLVMWGYGQTAPHVQSGSGSGSSSSVENPNAPEITFDHEVWDFGEVPEGPKVRHDFYFTNTGKEPLIIQNVRASCGCTTPYWPREPIPPGGRGKITVEYNTQGRPGAFVKTVTIYSNAKTPTKVIRIKGVVVRKEATGTPERKTPFGSPTK